MVGESCVVIAAMAMRIYALWCDEEDEMKFEIDLMQSTRARESEIGKAKTRYRRGR